MRATLIVGVLGLLVSACGSNTAQGVDSNNAPTYGDTGLPKNCRAIIKSNIDSVNSGEFSAEDALESIDRNCGEFGYAWGQ